MGAEFLSVRIKCHMSEILDHPDASHAESIVFPKDLPWANNYEGGNLLVAQVAAESGVENPTRAEVVSALLFKCAIKAASSTTTSMLMRRPSKLVHFLNVRSLLKSRLPQSAIGNILSIFSTTATNEQDIELPTLVRNLRKGVEVAYKKDQVEENELILEVVESMRKGKKPFDDEYENVYACSNLCKYPDYNVDFGWGKPKRVGLPNGPFKNVFFLKDYKIGGGNVAQTTYV
uniref:Acyltransferase n=1 Tax=Solanum tuberosum TaxID=4113 RepID=M1DI43_SOLTU